MLDIPLICMYNEYRYTDRGLSMDLSARRKRIKELYKELAYPIEALLTRKPFIKGHLYELKRKCGKPRCRCLKGELHQVMALSWSEGGKHHLRAIKESELDRIEKFTSNYRRFRQGRASVRRMVNEILSLANEIEGELLRIGTKGGNY